MSAAPDREGPTPLPPEEPVVLSVSELERRLEELPDRLGHTRGRTWTAQEDELLLRYWRTKRQSDVAKLFGVAITTAMHRYNSLVGSKS